MQGTTDLRLFMANVETVCLAILMPSDRSIISSTQFDATAMVMVRAKQNEKLSKPKTLETFGEFYFIECLTNLYLLPNVESTYRRTNWS